MTIAFNRQQCSYENHCQKFHLPERSFNRQYAPFYATRLNVLKKLLTERAKKKWGSNLRFKQLSDLTPESGRVCVIGTIFKHMELQPSILRDICEEQNLAPVPVRQRYTDDSDELILEDNLQRVILHGNIDVHSLVTGVVVAVFGDNDGENGEKFNVVDICYPGLPKLIATPSLDVDRYVILISGLGLSHSADVLQPLNLFVDLITGGIGDTDFIRSSTEIVRVIVAGNLLSETKKSHDFRYSSKSKSSGKDVHNPSLDGIKLADKMLASLAVSVDVDVLAGEHDPANHLLPQQPLHCLMFPLAAKYSTFHCITNPCESTIGGVRFIGSSGQNVQAIREYSKLDSSLEILEKIAEWGHLAPTAPDTLNAYPYHDEDPFIFTSCPQVFFAGNQTEFGTKTYTDSDGQKVQLISVPKFCESFTCAKVNLRTLECTPWQFSVD